MIIVDIFTRFTALFYAFMPRVVFFKTQKQAKHGCLQNFKSLPADLSTAFCPKPIEKEDEENKRPEKDEMPEVVAVLEIAENMETNAKNDSERGERLQTEEGLLSGNSPRPSLLKNNDNNS